MTSASNARISICTHLHFAHGSFNERWREMSGAAALCLCARRHPPVKSAVGVVAAVAAIVAAVVVAAAIAVAAAVVAAAIAVVAVVVVVAAAVAAVAAAIAAAVGGVLSAVAFEWRRAARRS